MPQVKDQFGNFKTENFAELRMKAFGATDSGEPKAANGIEQAPARFVCPSLKCLQLSPQAVSVLCRLALTAIQRPNGALASTPRHWDAVAECQVPTWLTVVQGVFFPSGLVNQSLVTAAAGSGSRDGREERVSLCSYLKRVLSFRWGTEAQGARAA